MFALPHAQLTRWLQVGMAVLKLQGILPAARVVYCSATGASEPRNLAYMTRLGLWGPGVPSFSDFQVLLLSLNSCAAAKSMTPTLCKSRGVMHTCTT